MKKSNKLLLGGFLAGLLLVAALNLTLYAKYKSGNFTVVNNADDFRAPAMDLYPNILFVSVKDVHRVNVKYSDVAKVEKRASGDIEIVRNGDTLIIKQKTGERRNHDAFSIQVPANATLTATATSLEFATDRKSLPGQHIINLVQTEALFPATETPQRYGQLTINAADHSSVLLLGKTTVDRVDVNLRSSTLECAEGDIGQLLIKTDSASRVSLQAKQLAKANITLQ